MPDLTRLGGLADTVAVVGVGDTDYPRDYREARAGGLTADSYGHAARALRAALDDAGLSKADIDGLIAGPTLASERLGEVLGIDPRWADQADAGTAILKAAQAIHSGFAECIALVYGNDQRTAGTAYGGPSAMGGDRHLSYVYFAPWGLTSQGALYAMMANRFMAETGLSEADLGRFVVAQRAHATLNPNAIMTRPLSLQDYLEAPYICEPLRMFDYCLINDGGVALILTTTERARRLPRPVVTVGGVGRSDLNGEATTLRPRLQDFYHRGHTDAAAQTFEMSGLGPEDIDLVGIYDSFSIHIPVALEGFGFCAPGDAAELARSGATGPGGRLPVNTSGGNLSESYMQGWNHQVELIRQLRQQAGARQVVGARAALYLSDVAGQVLSIAYRSGGAW